MKRILTLCRAKLVLRCTFVNVFLYQGASHEEPPLLYFVVSASVEVFPLSQYTQYMFVYFHATGAKDRAHA